MKSITTFGTKENIDEYINEVDMLAHATEEELVYLTPAKREFRYVISGWFIPTTTRKMLIIGHNGYGADSPIAEVAKIKINNLTTGESVLQTPVKEIPIIKDNVYRIDYGIYKNLNDNTWHALTNLFGQTTWNNELRYVVAYPEVTTFEPSFINTGPNVLGGIFKSSYENLPELIEELDNYFLDNSQVPQLVDVNDVVFEGHLTSVPGGIFNNCPYVKDVYFHENITYVGRVLYLTKSDPVIIPSNVYIGSLVKFLYLPHQFKIRKVIIPEENPYIKWDETVRCVVRKELVNGKIPIQTGGGIWENDYLYIPPGYVIEGSGYTSGSKLPYLTFEGRNTKIVNMSDYDGGTTFTGFKDAGHIKTLILPRIAKLISCYNNSLIRVANLVIPCKTALLVHWYDDDIGPAENGAWGARGAQYGYSMLSNGNMFRGCLGSFVNTSGLFDLRMTEDSNFTIRKSDRKLYVLDGTSSERESWTERYDRGNLPGSGMPLYVINYWTNGTTGTYDRDNVWHDITLKVLDDDGLLIQSAVDEINGQTNKTSLPNNFAFRQYTLNYLSEEQMTELINNLIPNE